VRRLSKRTKAAMHVERRAARVIAAWQNWELEYFTAADHRGWEAWCEDEWPERDGWAGWIAAGVCNSW
jgi:hypothetical protein